MENNLPAGNIRSKFVLPIYEHIRVNETDFVKIKCFIGYKVVAYKYKKHIEKALLKVKVLTGNDAGNVYKGKYAFATDGAYNEECMLKFGAVISKDRLYIFEGYDEYLLNDPKFDDLWIHHFDEKGKPSISNKIVLSKYTTIDELEKIQEAYNASTQKLIDAERAKDTVKADNIF